MNTALTGDQAHDTLNRVWPGLVERFAAQAPAGEWRAFRQRLEQHLPHLLDLLHPLYGHQAHFSDWMDGLVSLAARMWLARPPELKALDADRESHPTWFQSNRMVGGVCYVDLFAGNLNGLRAKIPYFNELGLTYLHLMPLFRCPAGNNDGGYAVSSYREVDPRLGTMDQLIELAAELRRNGISLVVDFVFNHTSNEHEWALKARAGEAVYRDNYWIFPDRQSPAAYERTVREIFPDEHPGAFSPFPANAGVSGGWVWTTFHSFQWDLNYANPAVFSAMAEEMLFLANVGVEVLRLDAVAFIWKQLGTNCENLPQAHVLIQAFNAVCRIAAPALLFKSEAIVHPDEVVKYIGRDECPLSYNPLLMALLWNSLATRKVRLLSQCMRTRFNLPDGSAWVNYVRGHDDIGWTFSDEDAALLGVKGHDHRQFLNRFYTGRFSGSFARGLPFQENPKTGDSRISGTAASLAGLEKALAEETTVEVELALRRILMIYSIILSIGGIPLIYLGDEIGTLNDYRFRDNPAQASDSRWVHRPRFDWDKAARRTNPATVEGRLYGRMRQLIELRTRHGAFAGGRLEVIELHDDHVLAYRREHDGEGITILVNFSEQAQVVSGPALGADGRSGLLTDLISGDSVGGAHHIPLPPYGFAWLAG